MRVLVCGDWQWGDGEFIFNYLYELWRKFPDMEIISGMAPGADTIAAAFARDWGIRLFCFPANWGPHRKAIRKPQEQIMSEGKPDLVVVFHDDLDNDVVVKRMVELAYKEGLHVFIETREGKY